MERRIIEFLKENKETFISGEEISRKLKVTRTAVWKHIQNLKENGYEIVAQPHYGYRLAGIPDKLLPDEISYRLNTKIFGKRIFSYVSTTSTNDVAYMLAEQSMPEGALILSEKQTKGRGRMGRQWASPPGGGLYFSVILRPKITPTEAGKITLMASISIAKVIRDSFGLEAVIKWPNDVYIGREKICGILTEMNAEQDGINFIILGIGINLNTAPGSLPKGAASLMCKTKKQVNRIEFLQKLLCELELHYLKIKNLKFEEIITQWRDLSMTLGRRVKVKWRSNLIEGQAMDIDSFGALIVRDDFGFFHHILSGDVSVMK
ncbi:MAG: biotin--[acetyl-CoA-carboxylase] ligase [Candidatus Omnitrophica bacterium]|nr:biotin--[acetyl-CoA-carboxylase] ligase [Candidatus Omnitrophota bacterium]